MRCAWEGNWIQEGGVEKEKASQKNIHMYMCVRESVQFEKKRRRRKLSREKSQSSKDSKEKRRRGIDLEGEGERKKEGAAKKA